VVPVFHGPGLADSYEVYAEIYASKFNIVKSPDQTCPGKDGRLNVCITPEDIQTGISEGFRPLMAESDLMNLYHNSARATLAYIRDTAIPICINGRERSIPLTGFWRTKGSNDVKCSEKLKMQWLAKDFGSFGVLCNNFGKHRFETGKNLYEIEGDIFLDILKSLYRKSVLFTIAVFEYAFRNLNIFHAT
jgi:hypothetical protein